MPTFTIIAPGATAVTVTSITLQVGMPFTGITLPASLTQDADGNWPFSFVGLGSYCISYTITAADGATTAGAFSTSLPRSSAVLQSNWTAITCDGQGNPQPGVKVWFQLVDCKTSGEFASREPFSATSDESGVVSVLLMGNSTYRYFRRDGGVAIVNTDSPNSLGTLPRI